MPQPTAPAALKLESDEKIKPLTKEGLVLDTIKAFLIQPQE